MFLKLIFEMNVAHWHITCLISGSQHPQHKKKKQPETRKQVKND